MSGSVDVDPMQVDMAGGVVSDAQAVAIEQTVIAAVMADRSVLHWVGDELVAEDFADPRLGRIFAGFYEMLAAKEPITPLTVADHLPGWGVRGIGLPELLLWESRVLPHEVSWFARKVHELAVRREVAVAGRRLQEQIARGNGAAGEVLATAIDHLREVQTRGVREDVHASTLADVLAQDVSYDWAIPGLLERGDRLILTGSEGGGKTTMLRQIAVMAAKESVNRAFESGLSDGVMFERRLFHALFATSDQKEGMDAFVAKRKAVFRHE